MQLNFQTTKKREIIDITEDLQRTVKESSLEKGLVHVAVLHTTCAITTADMDPETDLDYLDAFEQLVPKLNYRHPHDPSHTPDHILSLLIGTQLVLSVEHGEINLGSWQRIILIEFDGPRERKLQITPIKS